MSDYEIHPQPYSANPSRKDRHKLPKAELVRVGPIFQVAFRVTEILGIAAGLAALYLTIIQTQLSIEALRDQKISSAWQILALPGGGSTGKQYALQTLFQENHSVESVTIRCAAENADGGLFHNDEGGPSLKCVDGPDLSHIAIDGPAPSSSVGYQRAIRRSTIRGTYMNNSSLTNVAIEDSDLSATTLFNSKITGGAVVRVSFQFSDMRFVDFSGTYFDTVSFRGADLWGANFSNSLFARKIDGITAVDNTPNYSIDISDSRLCNVQSSLSPCSETLHSRFFDYVFFLKGHAPEGLSSIAPSQMVTVCTSVDENGFNPTGCNRYSVVEALKG
jgi:hypothetical protein